MNMMNCRRSFTTCLIALATTMSFSLATAEETVPASDAIYESLDGVRIGRVFLSPDERRRLDAVRHLEPGPVGAEGPVESADTESEAERPEGYGFIQVSGKAPRVFKDGDFVRVTGVAPRAAEPPPGLLVRHEDPAEHDGSE